MAAGEGQLIECHTDSEWEENFNKGIESNKLMVAFFSATRSDACRLINPSVEKDAKDFPQVIFVKADVDELPIVATKYEVSFQPTFTFFENGILADKYVGNDTTVLRNLIIKHAHGHDA